MKVLIVDDEPVARFGIRRLLEQETDVEVVGECGSGRAALKSICDLSPDLVYLDIQLPGLDGLEVLDRLDQEHRPALIFTTAFEQYALDAFAVQAIDYLVKPWRKDRFAQALERARLLIAAKRDPRPSAPSPGGSKVRFAVRAGDGTYSFLDGDQIDWIEAADNYVALHADRKRHLVRDRLDTVAARLRSYGFVRIHRSLIVNLNRVETLRTLSHGEFEISLRGGTVLTSSRRYRDELRRHFELRSDGSFRH